jgi:hypothetical protein
MGKFKQRYMQPDGWSLTNHWLVGYEWLVPGSRGSTYSVEATEYGFTCPCYGFTFHGKCRHVRSVINRIDVERVPEYKIL